MLYLLGIGMSTVDPYLIDYYIVYAFRIDTFIYNNI